MAKDILQHKEDVTAESVHKSVYELPEWVIADNAYRLLDLAGVESSTGSACTAGVPRPSHVLLAMGLDEDTARGAQRFTLGHTSTEADVDALLAALPAAYTRARQAGMAGHESSIQTAGTVFRQAAPNAG